MNISHQIRESLVEIDLSDYYVDAAERFYAEVKRSNYGGARANCERRAKAKGLLDQALSKRERRAQRLRDLNASR
tara:strand:- start:1416 stop:1640 length:225 start_codon:yes stop_codon:yes gene_type:complete